MHMWKRVVAAALLVAALSAGLLTGCSSSTDSTDLQGEWQVGDGTITVVFTGTEFKNSAGSFEYTLDTSAKTITYTYDGVTGDPVPYEFSEDKQQLTITEKDANGEDKVTTFNKISSDVSAEPRVDYGEDSDDSSSSDSSE